MSTEKIDPECVRGVARVDQDMARIKDIVKSQKPEAVESAIEAVTRLEHDSFEAMRPIAVGMMEHGWNDAKIDRAMGKLAKHTLATPDAWLISLLAIYGWNRMAEEICDARKMDAGIRPE